MEKISIVKYSPSIGDDLTTAQLVECYRDVFADEPWHEWLKCPRCQKYWGSKDQKFLAANKFRHCGAPLIDFWPREKVISDLYQEITPRASCWLATNNYNVIGFCWGYPITVTELQTKLEISQKINLAGNQSLVAYQDDIGVIAGYRGLKLAKKMFARRLDDFLTQDLKIGIARVRQHPKPSQTFLWFTKKLGYQIIAKYPKNDGRVILGRKLSGLKELLAI